MLPTVQSTGSITGWGTKILLQIVACKEEKKKKMEKAWVSVFLANLSTDFHRLPSLRTVTLKYTYLHVWQKKCKINVLGDFESLKDSSANLKNVEVEGKEFP